MRVLPMLESRRDPLEKCVFCPKLCRTACPVSNAEPRETLTPWGKMTGAWLVAHGDVPLDASRASPAWACTGCFGCRELCDHRNPVSNVLVEARAGLVSAAPESAKEAIERFAEHDAAARRSANALPVHPAMRTGARDGLLIGCGYLRRAPKEAANAVAALAHTTRQPMSIVQGCCGLPLRLAGAADRFRAHATRVVRATAGHARIVVCDPGCAMTLRESYREAGVALGIPVELLVELAAKALLQRVPPRVGQVHAEPVRWHDPCQLGRGLGIFAAPRRVLEHALGRAPDEFTYCRERATCSGAGGLVPITMPATSRTMARARLQEHLRLGGGRIVTGCASSLVALRKAAADVPEIAIDDLVSWIALAFSRCDETTT